jgi:hypothetical protein
MAVMPVPRETMMRLLIEIEQQLAGLVELVDSLDIQSDEATEPLYRMVCLEAARMIVEEKLNEGEKPGQPDWEGVLILCDLSKNWPDE